MPENWYSIRACIVSENDGEATIEKKTFDESIVASKKPYFMTHVYPKLKSENNAYVKNSNNSAIRRFGQYGIDSIDELEKYEKQTDEMIEYLSFYHRRMPVGMNPCVVNRVSWIFESEFKNYLSRYASNIKDDSQDLFDYEILKSGVSYSKSSFNRISELYFDYCKQVEQYQKMIKTEKIEKYDILLSYKRFSEFFRSECEKICTNEEELCDIVIDICYGSEKSKQFAWDICARTILKNLILHAGNKIHYPQMVECDGDFSYCGREFKMCELEVNIDDYT